MRRYGLNFALVTALSLLSAKAADITWDADTVASGAQDGTGTWDLSVTNWWNGTTNVAFTAGDNVTIGATLGPSTLTLGTSLSAGNLIFTNNGSAKMTTVNLGGNSLTLTGTLSTSGNVSGYNTILTNGTLILGNTASTAAAPDINKVTTNAANYGSVIGAAINVGVGTRFITGTTDRNDVARYSGDLRFDGAFSGSATVNFIGGGENSGHNMHFVLNANNSGFTGAVNLGKGDLTLANNSALSSSNAFTFNAAASGDRSSLFLFGHNVTIGALNDTSISGSTRFIRNGSLVGTSGLTNSAANGSSVALGLDANSKLTIQQSSNGTFGGVITDGPNDNGAGVVGTYRTLAIQKQGSSSLTLTGANTYTGGTTITTGPGSGGTGVASIIAGSPTALGTGDVVFTNSGQITGLKLNFVDGGVMANNIALPTASTQTDFVGTDGRTQTLSGVISGGSAAFKWFMNMDVASSNGVFKLTNASNSFRGTVYFNRGVLAITSDAVLGNAANLIQLDQTSNNGGLRFDANNINITHAVEMMSRFDTNVNGFDATISSNITGVGNDETLRFAVKGGTLSGGNSTGSLRLSGTNSMAASLTVASNTKLIAASSTALGNTTGTTLVQSGGTLALDTVGTYASNEPVTLNGAGVQLSGTGVGALENLVGTNTFNGPVTLGSSSSIGVTAGSLSLGGVISGAGMSLTKVGSGSLTVDSAATYSGGTIISGGSLLLGTNGSLSDSTAVSLTSTGTAFNISSISGSSETIASLAGATGSSLDLGGKTLIFGDTNDTEFAGGITGVGGSITKVGLGKTTLSGANTFTGPINLVGGTLLIGGSGALPSGSAINLSSGATLQTGSFTTTTGPLSLGLGDGIIDMNTSSSSITFLDTGSWVGVLSIWNYNGGIWDAGSADKIFLTSNTRNINPLSSVKFYSDNGGNQIGTGGTFVSGSNGQLVPVPEPTPLCAGLVLLTLATASRRRSAAMR